jgi:hypothetical protein
LITRAVFDHPIDNRATRFVIADGTQNCNPWHAHLQNGSDFIEIKKTLSFHSLENFNSPQANSSPNASTTVAPAFRNAFTLPACVPRPLSIIAPA